MFEFFKRLFPDKSEGGIKVDQATLADSAISTSENQKALSKTKYRIASCQSPGMERPHNEDTLFTFDCVLDGLDAPLHFGIYLVADGMGGHQGGEVASILAAQGASQYLMDHVFNVLMFDRQSISDDDLQKSTQDAVEEAQKLIRRRVPGGGTTLTMAMAVDGKIFYAHVGDSRIYLIDPDGKITLKTKDHSLVKRLVDLGEISESEASIHPQRNVLYRALGQMDPFEPDTGSFAMDLSDRLLICSDGLWGVLTEKQILGVLENASMLEAAACDLVDAANESGGPDNISVILVERIS